MTVASLRPASLLEVSHRTASGAQTFDPALREFLDDFYSNTHSRSAALAEEPLLLDDVKDAYIAAVAEHLAMRYRLEIPGWAEGHGKPLKKAFFAGGLESLKAILTVESPAAFRRRLLFVSKNALDRPSRRDDAAPPGNGNLA